MKKKFDFTAEMKEAQVTKSPPQNEYLEEEKRLLGINVKELAELNDNVYGLRTDLTALVKDFLCRIKEGEQWKILRINFLRSLSDLLRNLILIGSFLKMYMVSLIWKKVKLLIKYKQ